MSSVKSRIDRELIGFEQGINIKTIEQLRSQTRARFSPINNPIVSFSDKNSKKATTVIKINSIPNDPGPGNYTLALTSSNGKILKIKAAQSSPSSGKIVVNNYANANSFWNLGGFAISPFAGPEVRFKIDLTSSYPSYDPSSNIGEWGSPARASTIIQGFVYQIVTKATVDSIFVGKGASDNKVGVVFKASSSGNQDSSSADYSNPGRVRLVSSPTAYCYKIGMLGVSNQTIVENQRRMIAKRIHEAIELASISHLDVISSYDLNSPYEVSLKQTKDGTNGNKNIEIFANDGEDPNNARFISQKLTITGMEKGESGYPRASNGKATGFAKIKFTGVPTAGSLSIYTPDGKVDTFTLAQCGGGTSNFEAAGKKLLSSIQASFLSTQTPSSTDSKKRISAYANKGSALRGSSYNLNITSFEPGVLDSPFIISNLNNVTIVGTNYSHRMHNEDDAAYALGMFDSLDPIFKKSQSEEFLAQRIKRVTFDINNIINSVSSIYEMKSRIVGDDTLMITQEPNLLSGLSDYGEAGMFAPVTLTGQIDPAQSTTVAGTNTKFKSEILAGDRILVSGEYRFVSSVVDDDTLIVDKAFSNNDLDESPKVYKTPKWSQLGLSNVSAGKFTLKNWKLTSSDIGKNYFIDISNNHDLLEIPGRELSFVLDQNYMIRTIEHLFTRPFDDLDRQNSLILSIMYTKMNKSRYRKTGTGVTSIFENYDANPAEGPNGETKLHILMAQFNDVSMPYDVRFDVQDPETQYCFINTSNTLSFLDEIGEVDNHLITFYKNLQDFLRDNIHEVGISSIENNISIREIGRLTSLRALHKECDYELVDGESVESIIDKTNVLPAAPPIVKVNFNDSEKTNYYLKPNHGLELMSYGFGKKVDNLAFDDLTISGPRRNISKGNITINSISNWPVGAYFKLEDTNSAKARRGVEPVISSGQIQSFSAAVGPRHVTFTSDPSSLIAVKNNNESYNFGTQNVSTTREMAKRIYDAIEAARFSGSLGISPSRASGSTINLRQHVAGEAGNTEILFSPNISSLVSVTNFTDSHISYPKTFSLDPVYFLKDTGEVRFPIQETTSGLLMGYEFDGVIEPIEIRQSFAGFMIAERNFYGIKASLMGSYNYSKNRNESEVISNVINFEKTKVPPFLDNSQTLGVELGRSMIELEVERLDEFYECINVAIPSYIFNNEGVIYPFIDADERIKLALVLEANNPDNVYNDKLVSEVLELGNPVSMLSGDSRNLGGENFHQTSGFDFSSKTHPGSDSIVFGGLTYV